MFKFDFQLDDEDNEAGPSFPRSSTSAKCEKDTSRHPGRLEQHESCYHVTLEKLLDQLPEAISYSPIHHPSLSQPLLRRDLFDARFQLINSSTATSSDSLGRERNGSREEYVDAKTDLIPGLYEGGLKTWEGGMDLVEVLSDIGDLSSWVRGSRVLEVGCGTVIPTAYILRSLLSVSPTNSEKRTVLHVQDYNRAVLELVTLPNLVLAALPFLPAESLRPLEDAADVESVLPDLNQPGDLSITPRLKQAFNELLDGQGIQLRFSYGPWSGFTRDLEESQERYDLVMTAETIYAEDSVDSLIDVLRVTSGGRRPAGLTNQVELDAGLEKLDLAADWASIPVRDAKEAVVLVAAKVLYFGVGGGLQDFLHRLEEAGGWSSIVKEWVKGVGRSAVRIGWGRNIV